MVIDVLAKGDYTLFSRNRVFYFEIDFGVFTSYSRVA